MILCEGCYGEGVFGVMLMIVWCGRLINSGTWRVDASDCAGDETVYQWVGDKG